MNERGPVATWRVSGDLKTGQPLQPSIIAKVVASH
jgi:hypothetical protein